MRFVLRSKVHNATVTGGDVSYIGSIAIDRDLIDRAGLWVGERVLVVSNTSGARLETYVIEAPAGSGTIEMRGAAALTVRQGEQIIIMGFELVAEPLCRRSSWSTRRIGSCGTCRGADGEATPETEGHSPVLPTDGSFGRHVFPARSQLGRPGLARSSDPSMA